MTDSPSCVSLLMRSPAPENSPCDLRHSIAAIARLRNSVRRATQTSLAALLQELHDTRTFAVACGAFPPLLWMQWLDDAQAGLDPACLPGSLAFASLFQRACEDWPGCADLWWRHLRFLKTDGPTAALPALRRILEDALRCCGHDLFSGAALWGEYLQLLLLLLSPQPQPQPQTPADGSVAEQHAEIVAIASSAVRRCSSRPLFLQPEEQQRIGDLCRHTMEHITATTSLPTAQDIARALGEGSSRRAALLQPLVDAVVERREALRVKATAAEAAAADDCEVAAMVLTSDDVVLASALRSLSHAYAQACDPVEFDDALAASLECHLVIAFRSETLWIDRLRMEAEKQGPASAGALALAAQLHLCRRARRACPWSLFIARQLLRLQEQTEGGLSLSSRSSMSKSLGDMAAAVLVETLDLQFQEGPRIVREEWPVADASCEMLIGLFEDVVALAGRIFRASPVEGRGLLEVVQQRADALFLPAAGATAALDPAFRVHRLLVDMRVSVLGEPFTASMAEFYEKYILSSAVLRADVSVWTEMARLQELSGSFDRQLKVLKRGFFSVSELAAAQYLAKEWWVAVRRRGAAVADLSAAETAIQKRLSDLSSAAASTDRRRAVIEGHGEDGEDREQHQQQQQHPMLRGRPSKRARVDLDRRHRIDAAGGVAAVLPENGSYSSSSSSSVSAAIEAGGIAAVLLTAVATEGTDGAVSAAAGAAAAGASGAVAEGWCESAASRELYLSNLPYETTEESLRTLFLQDFADTLASLSVVGDPRDAMKSCRGIAFAVFVDRLSTLRALRALDQTKFLGRTISVQISNKPPKKEASPVGGAALPVRPMLVPRSVAMAARGGRGMR